jgi:two-component system, chemotaxis family, chemotaxis protein CheY
MAAVPLRVVVVDDNEALRENLAECLEAEGHVVSQAADGQGALTLLERTARPDVVVLDLVMPGLGGREVAATLRRRPELRDLRLVLMTGRETAAGGWPEFDAVLEKPFGLGELLSALGAARGQPQLG